MIRRFLGISVLCLSLTCASEAALVDFWDFNAQNNHSTFGKATLHTSWSGIGFGTLSYDVLGTEVGAPEGIDAGWSLPFIDLLDGLAHHRITIEGLNFTGLHSVSLTFAEKSSRIVSLGDHTKIEYNIDDTGWVELLSLDPVGSEWTLQTISFGNLLDNAGHVSIRITHHAFFKTGAVVSFDNIGISAVPEPDAMALAATAFLLGMLLMRRRVSTRR